MADCLIPIIHHSPTFHFSLLSLTLTLPALHSLSPSYEIAKQKKMITNKGDTESSSQPSSTPLECCMCGDFGLSHELFHCTVCQFRSQHRYCSNLYPKAKSYKACNWCLSNNEENKEKSNNSSNFSSSNKTNNEEDIRINNTKKKNKRKGYTHDSNNHGGLRRSSSGGALKLQVKIINNSSPLKKHVTANRSSPERSPSNRRRIITRGKLEEKLRRTGSEDISNKHVFRNKMRRYKLLDEF